MERSEDKTNKNWHAKALLLQDFVIILFALLSSMGLIVSIFVYPVPQSPSTLISCLGKNYQHGAAVIEHSLGCNKKYLRFLEDCLAKEEKRKRFIAKPYSFSPMTLSGNLKGEKISLVASGPLCDLYGFPLLPVSKEYLETEYSKYFSEKHPPRYPAITLNKELKFYSIAGLERKKYFEQKATEIAKTLKSSKTKIRNKNLWGKTIWILAGIGISLLLIKYINLTFLERILIIGIGLVSIATLMPSYSKSSGSYFEDDFHKISSMHRKQIEQKSLRLINKIQKDQELNKNSHKLLLNCLDNQLLNQNVISQFLTRISLPIAGIRIHFPGDEKIIEKYDPEGFY
jgi:hypothetical protein